MKFMKFKPMFSLILVLAVSLGTIAFAGSYKTSSANLNIKFIQEEFGGKTVTEPDQDAIENAVKNAFAIQEKGTRITDVKVKVIRSKSEAITYKQNRIKKVDYLVVYLPHKDTYYYETAKIELNRNYTLKKVVRNYVENSRDLQAIAEGKVSKDSRYADVEAVVSITVGSDYPTAVQAHSQMASLLRNAGYNVKVLTEPEATIANYKYWLAQPTVKIFWSVGHGSPSGLMLKDGTLSSSWFQTQSSTGFKNKLVYFNSCEVFKDPMKSAVLGTQVQKYIGGIPTLLVGPSEKVSLSFMKKAVTEKKAMTTAIREAERETNYPDQGAHGIGGSGSDYVVRPDSEGVDPDPTPDPTADPTPDHGPNPDPNPSLETFPGATNGPVSGTAPGPVVTPN